MEMLEQLGIPRRQGIIGAACPVTLVHFSHTTASVRQPKRTEWAEVPVCKSESLSGCGVHGGIPTQVPGLLSSSPGALPRRAERGTSVFPSSNRARELADISDWAQLHFRKMVGRAFFGDQTGKV